MKRMKVKGTSGKKNSVGLYIRSVHKSGRLRCLVWCHRLDSALGLPTRRRSHNRECIGRAFTKLASAYSWSRVSDRLWLGLYGLWGSFTYRSTTCQFLPRTCSHSVLGLLVFAYALWFSPIFNHSVFFYVHLTRTCIGAVSDNNVVIPSTPL